MLKSLAACSTALFSSGASIDPSVRSTLPLKSTRQRATDHSIIPKVVALSALRQLELIFDRKSNYISPCLLVENVAALVVQKEAGR